MKSAALMNPVLAFLKGKQAAPLESFAFSWLENGLPRGALVEISGAEGGGKTEAALRFLAQNPGVRVAWVEEEFSVYPCAFPQSRVGLERVLFVDAPSGEGLWAAHRILRSQAFGIVVLRMAGQAGRDEMALRRLQLAAEKSQVTVVLLSEEPARKGAWPIAVQLGVSRAADRLGEEGAALNVDVLKYKGQRAWRITIG